MKSLHRHLEALVIGHEANNVLPHLARKKIAATVEHLPLHLIHELLGGLTVVAPALGRNDFHRFR